MKRNQIALLPVEMLYASHLGYAEVRLVLQLDKG
jgi:hypothetical protein